MVARIKLFYAYRMMLSKTVETESKCSYFLSRDKQAELYLSKYIPVLSDSKVITDLYGF